MRKSESHFKTIACYAPASWMTAFRKQMKRAGYCVVNDSSAGTCVVYVDAIVVARGLRMSHMGWIVRADPNVVKAAPDAVNGSTTTAEFPIGYMQQKGAA